MEVSRTQVFRRSLRGRGGSRSMGFVITATGAIRPLHGLYSRDGRMSSTCVEGLTNMRAMWIGREVLGDVNT